MPLEPENDLIFVSIAVYRDPQLIATIEDCLGKADNPARLRIGICWQHAEDELPLPYMEDDRFRIVDVAWRDSKGACWARAEVMTLWRGAISSVNFFSKEPLLRERSRDNSADDPHHSLS